jgi:DNA-binding GntR family transcriptional regulator
MTRSSSIARRPTDATPTPEEEALVLRWKEASASLDEARSLADVIMTTLSGAIVNRELPPEWRLREERLATLFGVSRTPIREALAGLANTGLARRDDRGSLRVSAITPEQILDVYAVRKSLEGLSAALAAESASSRAIAQLRQIQRACERAVEVEDSQALAAANSEFHLAMASATGNELLIRFIADVENWVQRFPTTTLSFPGRPDSALAEHEDILAAIESRDSVRAEQLARQHMGVAEEIRMQMLFGDSASGASDR